VLIGEVGGTVGDIESLPFLEAIRQFRWDRQRENVLYVHLTLVPYISTAGEVKTKPTQHSVKELTGLGIQPDILLCRTDRPLEAKIKAKIAHFCNVDEQSVITARDVDCIYEVPLALHEEGIDERLVEKLNMWTGAPNLAKWQKVVQTAKTARDVIRIAVVGKYVDLADSYKSPQRSADPRWLRQRVQGRARLRRLGEDRQRRPARQPHHRRRRAGADGLRAPRHRG
jgi:CTP synthase